MHNYHGGQSGRTGHTGVRESDGGKDKKMVKQQQRMENRPRKTHSGRNHCGKKSTSRVKAGKGALKEMTKTGDSVENIC